MSPKRKKRLLDVLALVATIAVFGMGVSTSILLGAIVSWIVGGSTWVWGLIFTAMAAIAILIAIGGAGGLLEEIEDDDL